MLSVGSSVIVTILWRNWQQKVPQGPCQLLGAGSFCSVRSGNWLYIARGQSVANLPASTSKIGSWSDRKPDLDTLQGPRTGLTGVEDLAGRGIHDLSQLKMKGRKNTDSDKG